MAETAVFGPFVLDRRKRVLTRNGEVVPIGHRSYVLLETLLDAGGETVHKATLMERGWPGVVVEEGNLTVQIAALRKQLGGDAEALIVTVPRVGYRLVAPAVARGGPPLIAVLPFSNLSSDAEQSYFADGVVDDLITALSRFTTFAVLSRGSAFALRDRAPDGQTAGARELGVRYALEGSVRRVGQTLRITTQLVDLTTDAGLWGEKFDRAVSDVFDFQDRITESVVGVIEPTVRHAEIERARRKHPSSLDAYDLFLRALPFARGMDPDGHATGIELLRRSAALDPTYAMARAYASWTYETRAGLSLPPLGPDDRETCLALAREALALDGDDPLIRAICGFVLLNVSGEFDRVEGLRRAAEANPNNIIVINRAGAGCLITGAYDEAYQWFHRAYRLSPGALDAHESLTGLALTEFMRGKDEAAIEWAQRSLATFNDWLFTYEVLAAANARLGRLQEAAAAVDRYRALAPRATIEQLVQGSGTYKDRYLAALVPQLRKAGFPER
jgi:TolB-like protein/tetratricopeptide (TPR) repeat protein